MMRQLELVANCLSDGEVSVKHGERDLEMALYGRCYENARFTLGSTYPLAKT